MCHAKVIIETWLLSFGFERVAVVVISDSMILSHRQGLDCGHKKRAEPLKDLEEAHEVQGRVLRRPRGHLLLPVNVECAIWRFLFNALVFPFFTSRTLNCPRGLEALAKHSKLGHPTASSINQFISARAHNFSSRVSLVSISATFSVSHPKILSARVVSRPK